MWEKAKKGLDYKIVNKIKVSEKKVFQRCVNLDPKRKKLKWTGLA